MSVGLIVALIVLIAVVLSLAVDDDDRTAQTSAPAAPLAYTADGAGEGFVSGEGQAVVPALRAYTGEFQGEGRLNTAGDLSMIEPSDGYHPNAGKFGFTEGDVTLSYEEQARLAHDEMLFKEWNDPLGWQAIPEREAVMSWEDSLFLEQNGVYDLGRDLAVVPEQPVVDSYEHMKFIEINTQLPDGTDDAPPVSDRQGFTEN